MKKLFLFALIAVFFTSCQTPVDESLQDDQMLKGGKSTKEKVDLCHLNGNGNYISIKVSVNALKAHLAHGDKLQYSPEGTYVFDYDLNGTIYKHAFEFTNFDGETFDGMGYFPDTPPYQYEYEMEGTVGENGELNINTVEPGHPTWSFSGIVDECGGIVNLDEPWAVPE